MDNRSQLAHPSCTAPSRHCFSRTIQVNVAWWVFLAVALVALWTAPPPAHAEDLPTTVQVTNAQKQPVDLMVGEGRLLHFDGPVESVFIGDASIGDVKVIAADMAYVYGKKSGTTNLLALTSGRTVKANLNLRVAINSDVANEAQQKLHPGSRAELSMIGQGVVATGHTQAIEEAVAIENTAEMSSASRPLNDTTLAGSQQVNIRVRFAEVNRTELKRLGINWHIFGGVSASAGGGFPGRAGASAGGGLNIDAVVEAMQRNGLLTVLAEPNLTAVTGQPASFLAGGEVPIPIAQSSGAMSIEYKPFGVSLNFTPTIIRTNRIALHVRPEVSAINPAAGVKLYGTDVPSFTMRRADTTVEVASGQTFAIGGLFQRQLSQQLDKLPGIGDVPILGALFTSEHYRRDETELVILITPYLVTPSRHQLATPLDRPRAAPSPSPRYTSSSSLSRKTGVIIK
ncbi:MAG: type II and III secretion system protein family protein [Alphaproteobacteria bacterium]|nr:type II and III secretion system protein family protein [Alphaproteobacteria bacterium]